MSEYLTLVFDASELAYDERLALCHRAASMSWTHALDERDELDAKLEDSQDWEEVAIRFQAERDAMRRIADCRARQRDELAAQVSDIRDELRDRAAQAWCGCGHPACKRCRDDARTEAILARHPTTSLARLKAEWQAEALVQFSDNWDWERSPTHKDLRQAADKLRRQGM